MKQSLSWEANSHSESRNTHPLWNPKVHYHVHKNLLLVPILSQMHSVHPSPPYSPNIHSNIIFPSMPMSSNWSFPLRFSDQNFVYIFHLSYTCYMPHPSHPPCFDHPNNILRSIQLWSFSLCSLLQLPATSSYVQIFSSTPSI